MNPRADLAWYERARAHGARVLEPPTAREYGSAGCHTSSCALSACSTVPVTRLSLIR